MAKTKREYILLTCFLSGAAAIISLVSLGTQQWVTSLADDRGDATNAEIGAVNFGLFGGVFEQRSAVRGSIDLTMICLLESNICALLCGPNMSDNLKHLYEGSDDAIQDAACGTNFQTALHKSLRDGNSGGRIFINAGVWLTTIIFLVISAVLGLFSAGLSVWNTATNPYQVYFSIFGLYIYNAAACFCIALSIVLWGAMFGKDLTQNIPTYKTFLEEFSTTDRAKLGWSYWINILSAFLYLSSIALLYVRNYLISKEPKVDVQLEDNADPGIYLY